MDLMKTRQMLKNGKSIYDLPLRVAYYARVSSEKDVQLNSLDKQITYYDNRIKTNNNWKFAGGYVDEGLSGSSVKKRDDFNRMIADGERGLFDLVFVKLHFYIRAATPGREEEKDPGFFARQGKNATVCHKSLKLKSHRLSVNKSIDVVITGMAATISCYDKQLRDAVTIYVVQNEFFPIHRVIFVNTHILLQNIGKHPSIRQDMFAITIFCITS